MIDSSTNSDNRSYPQLAAVGGKQHGLSLTNCTQGMYTYRDPPGIRGRSRCHRAGHHADRGCRRENDRQQCYLLSHTRVLVFFSIRDAAHEAAPTALLRTIYLQGRVPLQKDLCGSPAKVFNISFRYRTSVREHADAPGISFLYVKLFYLCGGGRVRRMGSSSQKVLPFPMPSE